jgi:hypothetical protein
MLFRIIFGLRLLRYYLVVLALVIIVAGFLRCYHLLRGRRDRESGIECMSCKRRAFPVLGTANRYRCAICRTHFTGPGHIN